MVLAVYRQEESNYRIKEQDNTLNRIYKSIAKKDVLGLTFALDTLTKRKESLDAENYNRLIRILDTDSYRELMKSIKQREDAKAVHGDLRRYLWEQHHNIVSQINEKSSIETILSSNNQEIAGKIESRVNDYMKYSPEEITPEQYTSAMIMVTAKKRKLDVKKIKNNLLNRISNSVIMCFSRTR